MRGDEHIPQVAPASSLDFLLRLFQRVVHDVELRAKSPADGSMVDRIFTHSLGDVVEFVTKNAGANIFFGVATRQGGGGKKENCREVAALWCDADFKNSSEADVWRRVKAFSPKPSIIVASGNGVHLYWLLRSPVPAQAEVIEPILRGLARALGGDGKSAEMARVMRLPGTLNHKYRPPRLSDVVHMSEQRCRLEDFADQPSRQPAAAPDDSAHQN